MPDRPSVIVDVADAHRLAGFGLLAFEAVARRDVELRERNTQRRLVAAALPNQDDRTAAAIGALRVHADHAAEAYSNLSSPCDAASLMRAVSLGLFAGTPTTSIRLAEALDDAWGTEASTILLPHGVTGFRAQMLALALVGWQVRELDADPDELFAAVRAGHARASLSADW